MSNRDTSEVILKDKSASIRYQGDLLARKSYKGDLLALEFVEDLEDEESHTCNCHQHDWCTCGAARLAEHRKARKAEGKGKGKPPVSPGRIDNAAKRVRYRDRKNRV